MYNRDKQTGKNTKLHILWTQGARITPPQNCNNNKKKIGQQYPKE